MADAKGTSGLLIRPTLEMLIISCGVYYYAGPEFSAVRPQVFDRPLTEYRRAIDEAAYQLADTSKPIIPVLEPIAASIAGVFSRQ
ncbi:hypothetical protein JM93_02881 [Roseibium hamelinense]|uniref:Uncharacterized protein n=1 Tax=Roseibium hamelinense TaxID=150831 RepID=A0A562SYA8_9HYPH|nr:hypothetical protein [Roseibium hamelinense]MTI43655.1 hypothetical protein [Roseibium hamelinense]TWI86173.1 hypothetical protein JM93_02881 [Roseibium hamelinense]